MPDVRLRREERLKSRKQLASVFSDGRSFAVFPIRCVWILTPGEGSYPVKVAFSVSRRRWKRAVDRNLFKRRMREAYRLQKHLLDTSALPADKQILIACIYTASTGCTFEQIQSAMTRCLVRIFQTLPQTT